MFFFFFYSKRFTTFSNLFLCLFQAIGAVAVDLAIVGAVVVARLLVTVGATDPDRIRKLTTSVFFFFTVS